MGMNKSTIIKMSIVVVLVITGIFSIVLLNNREENAFLKESGLEGKSIKEMVSYLETSVTEEGIDNASINQKQLVLMSKSSQYTYDLPKDQFYLSIAPYMTYNHPCAIHNLITCRGELSNTTIHVKVVDEDHQVIIDDDYKSGDNGFFGLWLPRDQTLTLTVSYGDLSVTDTVTTMNSSNTCLTDLKLN
jgi:hypothetical protein